MFKKTLLWLAALLWFSAGFAAEGEKTWKMMMLWSPQAQFAGPYLAEAAGLYAQSGLKVQLLHPAPEADTLEQLASGEIDVAVHWLLSGLQEKLAGRDLVCIGQISQVSAQLLVARKSSRILALTDLRDKRIGIWLPVPLRLPAEALLRQRNIAYRMLPLLRTIDLFLYDGVDAMIAMYYNEYFQLLGAGFNENELTTFALRDYGFDIPEDGLYVRRETFEKYPEACRQLVQATMRGWRLAFSDPVRALAEVKRRSEAENHPYNQALQSWMLQSLERFIFPAGQHTGELREPSFRQALQLLSEPGRPPALKFEEFYPRATESQEH